MLKLQEAKIDGSYSGRKMMYLLPAAQATLALLTDAGHLPSACPPQWELGHSGKQFVGRLGLHMTSATQCEVLIVLTGRAFAFGQSLLCGRFCCK